MIRLLLFVYVTFLACYCDTTRTVTGTNNSAALQILIDAAKDSSIIPVDTTSIDTSQLIIEHSEIKDEPICAFQRNEFIPFGAEPLEDDIVEKPFTPTIESSDSAGSNPLNAPSILDFRECDESDCAVVGFHFNEKPIPAEYGRGESVEYDGTNFLYTDPNGSRRKLGGECEHIWVVEYVNELDISVAGTPIVCIKCHERERVISTHKPIKLSPTPIFPRDIHEIRDDLRRYDTIWINDTIPIVFPRNHYFILPTTYTQ
jgi:hypothetical protein